MVHPLAPLARRATIWIAAASARNAWTVGSYARGSSLLAVIERWNGESWRRPV
jgi:hypothetical protein